MRSISPLLLLLVSAISQAQVDALQDYLKIRKSSGITTASGVEALETVFGKRTFEIVGHVKGSIRSGESTDCTEEFKQYVRGNKFLLFDSQKG